jgi:hypothetical protein
VEAKLQAHLDRMDTKLDASNAAQQQLQLQMQEVLTAVTAGVSRSSTTPSDNTGPDAQMDMAAIVVRIPMGPEATASNAIAAAAELLGCDRSSPMLGRAEQIGFPKPQTRPQQQQGAEHIGTSAAGAAFGAAQNAGKAASATQKQPAPGRSTYAAAARPPSVPFKINIPKRHLYDVIYISHLLHQRGFHGYSVKEYLTPAALAYKNKLLSEETEEGKAFKIQRDEALAHNNLIKWKNGLPYSLPRGAAPADALPFGVTLQELARRTEAATGQQDGQTTT